MEASDEQLFSDYRAGDPDGIGELVERYRGPLHTVIQRMVGDRGDAEDVFQETFFRVIKHRERFDETRKFSTWIYAIATNLCRDRLRRRGSDPVSVWENPPDAPGDGNPETESWGREFQAALAAALEQLTPAQKEVFLLREFGGLSFKQIAEATDTNVNTALGRMRQALSKLRVELGDFVEART